MCEARVSRKLPDGCVEREVLRRIDDKFEEWVREELLNCVCGFPNAVFMREWEAVMRRMQAFEVDVYLITRPGAYFARSVVRVAVE